MSGLLKYSLTQSSSNKGAPSVLQTSPPVSGTWDFLRLVLLVNTEAKKAFSTPAFSTSCLTRSPASFSNGPAFSLVFSLPLMYLEEPFLLLVASLGRFSSK